MPDQQRRPDINEHIAMFIGVLARALFRQSMDVINSVRNVVAIASHLIRHPGKPLPRYEFPMFADRPKFPGDLEGRHEVFRFTTANPSPTRGEVQRAFLKQRSELVARAQQRERLFSGVSPADLGVFDPKAQPVNSPPDLDARSHDRQRKGADLASEPLRRKLDGGSTPKQEPETGSAQSERRLMMLEYMARLRSERAARLAEIQKRQEPETGFVQPKRQLTMKEFLAEEQADRVARSLVLAEMARPLLQRREFEAVHSRHAKRLETVAHLDRRPIAPRYAPAVEKAATRVDRAAAFRKADRQNFRAANNAARQAHTNTKPKPTTPQALSLGLSL